MAHAHRPGDKAGHIQRRDERFARHAITAIEFKPVTRRVGGGEEAVNPAQRRGRSRTRRYRTATFGNGCRQRIQRGPAINFITGRDKAVLSAGFDPEPEWPLVNSIELGTIAGVGRAHHARHLRQEMVPPMGLCCLNDDIAKCLDAHGHQCPFTRSRK